MKNDFTIVDIDGVLVANRLTREECWHLRGLEKTPCGFVIQAREPLVQARKRRPYIWVAIVAPAVITSTLRTLRGIQERTPIAEAMSTGHWEAFSNAKGAGRVFVLNERTCFNYRTTEPCRDERMNRLAQRPDPPTAA